MNVNSVLLFDIAEQAYAQGLWGWIGAALVLAALLGLWWQRRRSKGVYPPAFALLMGLVCIGGAGVERWDRQRLLTALQNGQTRVAEGLVSSYSMQHLATYNPGNKRYDRRQWESFNVGAVAFGFDRLSLVVGFTNQGDSPVALADGMQLRLHYLEDVEGDFSQRRILRLEQLCAPGGCTRPAAAVAAGR